MKTRPKSKEKGPIRWYPMCDLMMRETDHKGLLSPIFYLYLPGNAKHTGNTPRVIAPLAQPFELVGQ